MALKKKAKTINSLLFSSTCRQKNKLCTSWNSKTIPNFWWDKLKNRLLLPNNQHFLDFVAKTDPPFPSHAQFAQMCTTTQWESKRLAAIKKKWARQRYLQQVHKESIRKKTSFVVFPPTSTRQLLPRICSSAKMLTCKEHFISSKGTAILWGMAGSGTYNVDGRTISLMCHHPAQGCFKS